MQLGAADDACLTPTLLTICPTHVSKLTRNYLNNVIYKTTPAYVRVHPLHNF